MNLNNDKMRTYTNVKDLGNLREVVKEALEVKKNRFAYKHIGENKTLLMVFLTPVCVHD